MRQVPAPYMMEIAERGGPCPRRQDLDQSRLVVGKQPAGRKLVVSHGWESEQHPCPSGTRLKRLANELR
jgi:hypothetical protein